MIDLKDQPTPFYMCGHQVVLINPMAVKITLSVPWSRMEKLKLKHKRYVVERYRAIISNLWSEDMIGGEDIACEVLLQHTKD